MFALVAVSRERWLPKPGCGAPLQRRSCTVSAQSEKTVTNQPAMPLLCLSPLNYCTLRVHRAWNELVVFRTSFLVAVDRADTAFARRLCVGRWRSCERAANPRHNPWQPLCACGCAGVCVCVCAGVRLCGRATPSRRCWPHVVGCCTPLLDLVGALKSTLISALHVVPYLLAGAFAQ